jgi:hypothetical protein
MARNAAKQAASRSQRTTRRRYFCCNQAQVRSAWKRGTSLSLGLPRGFLAFQTRSGSCARMPRVRNRSWASWIRPNGVMLLWVYGERWRAVFEHAVLAEYHCP